MILVSWLACLALRPIVERELAALVRLQALRRNSTSIVWMSSGFSRATCSMSTPPRAEAMNATVLRAAIDEDREIQFLGDVVRFADQHQVDRQRAAAGLVGRPCSCRASPPPPPSPRRASCTSFTPPALPRPPAWICALTTHCVAAERAAPPRPPAPASWRPCRPAPECRSRRTVPWPGIRGNSCGHLGKRTGSQRRETSRRDARIGERPAYARPRNGAYFGQDVWRNQNMAQRSRNFDDQPRNIAWQRRCRALEPPAEKQADDGSRTPATGRLAHPALATSPVLAMKSCKNSRLRHIFRNYLLY